MKRHFSIAALLLACAMPVLATDRFDIAITVDDVPLHGALPPRMTRLGIAQSTLATLKAHHVVEAFGFVNAGRMTREPGSEAVLDAWRAAGYPLGNHTATHMNLARAESFDAWRMDVVAGEPAIAARMAGADWHWLRFPNLALGERQPEALDFLKQRGYKIADVSLAFGDWVYTDAYARCVTTGDSAAIAAMRRHYLAGVDRSIAQMRENSRRVFGRVIPQVLLTHLGGWSAVTLPDVLTRLDAAGARYITLAQAHSDAAYAQPGGGSLVARAAKAHGIRLDAGGEDAPLGVGALCR